MDAILEPARKLLSQVDFEKLEIDEKITIVKNELLNSIYGVIIEGRSKLPDLIKAQSIINKEDALKKKPKDPKTQRFTSTPLPNEPSNQ